MPLFEVAVVTKTPNEKTLEYTEKLVFGPKAIVAKNSNAAQLVAARDPEFPADIDMNAAEVLVVPFA